MRRLAAMLQKRVSESRAMRRMGGKLAAVFLICGLTCSGAGSPVPSPEAIESVRALSEWIRSNPEASSALGGLESIEMLAPESEERVELGDGIVARRFSGEASLLSASALSSALSEMGSEARIVGAEWVPVADEGSDLAWRARFRLLVERPDPGAKRWVISGALSAANHLSSGGGEGIGPLGSVALHELTIASRGGRPPFHRALEEEGGAGEPDFGITLVYDLNGDGLPEIVAPRSNRLFLNMGRFQFRERPLAQHPLVGVEAALLADFVGNGRPDLLVCLMVDAPLLYLSDPRHRYTVYPRETHEGSSGGGADGGVSLPESIPFALAAGDRDGDGDLDLWVGRSKPRAMGEPQAERGVREEPRSMLWINRGNGEFEPDDRRMAAERLGLRQQAAAWLDVNGDGALDLVTVADFAGARAWLNDGTGQFTEASESVFPAIDMLGQGLAWGDFDGDGRAGIAVAGHGNPFLATESGQSRQAGLAVLEASANGRSWSRRTLPARAERGWHVAAAPMDVNADGRDDLFLAAGGVRTEGAIHDFDTLFWRDGISLGEEGAASAMREAEQLGRAGWGWGLGQRNRLWLGGEEGLAWEAAFLYGLAGSNANGQRGAVSADLDGDGDEDLVMVETSAAERTDRLVVLRNDQRRGGDWIGSFVRESPGRPSFGAVVTLVTDQGTRARILHTGTSQRMQGPQQALFSMRPGESARALVIDYPDGLRQIIDRPEVNRYHPFPR